MNIAAGVVNPGMGAAPQNIAEAIEAAAPPPPPPQVFDYGDGPVPVIFNHARARVDQRQPEVDPRLAAAEARRAAQRAELAAARRAQAVPNVGANEFAEGVGGVGRAFADATQAAYRHAADSLLRTERRAAFANDLEIARGVSDANGVLAFEAAKAYYNLPASMTLEEFIQRTETEIGHRVTGREVLQELVRQLDADRARSPVALPVAAARGGPTDALIANILQNATGGTLNKGIAMHKKGGTGMQLRGRTKKKASSPSPAKKKSKSRSKGRKHERAFQAYNNKIKKGSGPKLLLSYDQFVKHVKPGTKAPRKKSKSRSKTPAKKKGKSKSRSKTPAKRSLKKKRASNWSTLSDAEKAHRLRGIRPYMFKKKGAAAAKKRKSPCPKKNARRTKTCTCARKKKLHKHTPVCDIVIQATAKVAVKC